MTQPDSIRILHVDSNHPVLTETLGAAGFINEADYTHTKAEIEDKIHQYQGMVIRSRFSIDRAFIDKAVNLRFIARVGAGLENIDTAYAAERGIALIAAPEGNRNAVAEHTLALLLNLLNKVGVADSEVRSGQWNREKNRGEELDGKTVGIIGYGHMGKAFARKLRGFDVRVLCYDIADGVGDQQAEQVALETLKREADVLSLHIPWTPETNNMVDARFLSGFSKPIWLLNTSRGKNVVTEDLVAALESGMVKGAGLDVLEYERSSFEHLFEDDGMPDVFRRLLSFSNVLLTPHVAGWTVESHIGLGKVIADKIVALFSPETEPEEDIPKVTGIGGFFFKSAASKELVDWYRVHLGLKTDDYGCTFWWKDQQGHDCSTQWSPFSEDTTYFAPSDKPFMQNFRVNNLYGLLERLKAAGVEVCGAPQEFEYGKFGWIIDPEGNKVELWEPYDKAFL